MKRMAAAVLAAALCFASVPAEGIALSAPIVAAAADSGTCGEHLTWTLDSEGTLTISGEGAMANWGWTECPWFDYRKAITAVVIGDGVTSIGNNAFDECSGLTSVIIPDSVTRIGYLAFGCCRSLTAFTIPESVTSIDNAAFYDCRSLTAVTILNPDCEIYDWSETFCTKYDFETKTAIYTGTIHGYTGSTAEAYAKKYDRTFVSLNEAPAAGFVASGECGEKLTWTLDNEGTLTISGEGTMADWGWKEERPWSDHREKITAVVIGDGVTSIDNGAFNDCSALTSVNIPDSVTSIGESVFNGCSSLTAVTIPNGVTSIGNYAFNGCFALTAVTIPDSVISIGDYAFEFCTALTSVTIPESVTYIGELAFTETPWLADMQSKDPLVVVNGILIDGKTVEGACVIPDGVKSIGNMAFTGCQGLTSVIIPDGVTSIREGAFFQCGALASVTIPDSVTSIGRGAFCLCSALTAVTIPESVTSIANEVFYDCGSLADVTILNPDCEIFDSVETFCNVFDIASDTIGFTGTIHGYTGSTAEAYARKYDRRFISLGEAPATDPVLSLGDLTGDGQINASDAARILMASAIAGVTGDTGLTAAETAAADVTKDGKVDASDAAKVLMYSAAVGTGFQGTMEEYLK